MTVTASAATLLGMMLSGISHTQSSADPDTPDVSAEAIESYGASGVHTVIALANGERYAVTVEPLVGKDANQ